MGCCGCQHDLGNKFNLFEITFVYLIERIYQIDTNKNTPDIERVSNNNQILMLHEETLMTIDNVNELSRIMLLNFGCWHFYLERNQHYDPCIDKCPYCLGTIFEYVKPVSQTGLAMILVFIMIVNKEANMTPSTFIQKFINYPQVRRVIYCCQSSMKIDKAMSVHITILWLICANMLQIRIE